MQIGFLTDHEDLIPEVVEWHHREWAYLRPGDTIMAREARLRAALGRNQIPSFIIATEDGHLVGTAMLVESDMTIRPVFSPWLAGVFVVPASRKRGAGVALVCQAETLAASLGFEKLFLYTPNTERFYLRLGWLTIEHTAYLGAEVVVMTKSITPNQSVEQTSTSVTGPLGADCSRGSS